MSFTDQAKALTVKWLNLLGLADWSVRVEVCDIGGNLGECCASWDYLEAVIRYRDPAIHGAYELEPVVAHEVCHLPFSVFETQAGSWERRAEEHLVERFSRAMLAIVRGNPGMSTAKLSQKLRAIVGASVRARRAMNNRRYRMDPKLLELLLKAGEFSGREDVPEDVKELLGQLAAAVATGAPPPDAGAGDDAPPAAEETDADPDPNAPPAAEDEPTVAARASIDALTARAKRDAEAAASMAAKARKSAESRLRAELFAGAPDVFPPALPKTREPYAAASPDEIERYITSYRARTATDNAPPKTPPVPAGARARAAAGEPREPIDEAKPIQNPGGLMIFAGGNRRMA